MDVLMTELFRTDIGLLSLFTILFIVGMSVFFVMYFRKKIAHDAAEHERQLRQGMPVTIVVDEAAGS